MMNSQTQGIHITYNTRSTLIRFAVGELTNTLTELGREVVQTDLGTDVGNEVVVISTNNPEDASIEPEKASLPPESFKITRGGENNFSVIIHGGDETGLMYGALDIAERIRNQGAVDSIDEKEVSPTVGTRAIKFNLPWSPYRCGEQNDLHFGVCRDLDFWRQFLDMMAKNRFNTLSLWNLHPFTFMIRPKNFPEACPFSDRELKEWKEFWEKLFKMAHGRGIETYVINWNMVVSPEFEEAYDIENQDTVKKYSRECVTQLINEYENLDGIGGSYAIHHLAYPGVCRWFRDLPPAKQQNWIKETMVDGIEEADRNIKFIDRSCRADSVDEMRRVIDVASEVDNIEDIMVPTKFNWSHGHSSTKLELTHDYRDGKVDDALWNPEPENYDLAWTIRNEDFFVLRWGDHEFIRDHIRENYIDKDYVGGYFVGSEGFIPAKDISHKPHSHQTWQYIFEKQWLFYKLWGRLLYNPDTPNSVFEDEFENRYADGIGERMLTGYTAASKMPEELASFYAGNWDYALYSEGFVSMHFRETLGVNDKESPFISIDELIYQKTLDDNYLSIPTFVEMRSQGESIPDGTITPLELSQRVAQSGQEVLDIAQELKTEFGGPTPANNDEKYEKLTWGPVHSQANAYVGALECEILDLLTWGQLSLYFAKKLEGGVALEHYRQYGDEESKNQAVARLESAEEHWNDIVQLTESHYREHPYAEDWRENITETTGEEAFPYPDDFREEATFSWKKYLDQVKRDIRIAEEAQPGRENMRLDFEG